MAKRNPYAAALSHGIFKPKRVRPGKGKGSYDRRKLKLKLGR